MPKLPPDEKLFTPYQLSTYAILCAECGETYGQHKAGTFQCPSMPPYKGWLPATFVVPSVDLKPPTGLPRLDRMEKIVSFNCSRGLRNAQVVEVVPGGKLPTFKGLRHIADKRRQPKPRRDESYVLCDITGPGPVRDRLFWPEASSIHWEVIIVPA